MRHKRGRYRLRRRYGQRRQAPANTFKAIEQALNYVDILDTDTAPMFQFLKRKKSLREGQREEREACGLAE